MKFSVLLPTKNRLEYLRYALETVRRQDEADWEIIVSDNCSEEDVAGYVQSLGDARIRYVRTSQPLPVTDNWNFALQHSTGDYVIMLGDDDGLVDGYFSNLRQVFREFPDPDFVYTSAYFYSYPGVIPEQPQGFLRRDRNRLLQADRPFWLERSVARSIVQGYLNFRMPVASNMQFSVISRRAIARLQQAGAFFQSPFPDFYATPALFLTATRILIYPQPMAIVGISPKSYGFFHFNRRERQGVEFLRNTPDAASLAQVETVLLPGTDYYNSWLLAMQLLADNFAREAGLRVAYQRYRFLQILHVHRRFYSERQFTPAEVRALYSHMRLWEKVIYGLGLRTAFGLMQAIPPRSRTWIIDKLRPLIGQHTFKEMQEPTAPLANMLEVFELTRRNRAQAAAPA